MGIFYGRNRIFCIPLFLEYSLDYCFGLISTWSRCWLGYALSLLMELLCVELLLMWIFLTDRFRKLIQTGYPLISIKRSNRQGINNNSSYLLQNWFRKHIYYQLNHRCGRILFWLKGVPSPGTTCSYDHMK